MLMAGLSPVPGFGFQLQDVSTFGVPAEAKVNINYTESNFTFADGEIVQLRTPEYKLQNPYTGLPADYLISPRMAPSVFGIGLLENIPEATILSFADENDKDNDGISGKAQLCMESRYTKNGTWQIRP